MNDAQNRKITAKTLLLVVGIAVITAVLMTLIQTWILGKANVAVTGGMVGAITVILAMKTIKKKSD
jgi:multisubunit Na+/H+ antiporter MnhB subunit